MAIDWALASPAQTARWFNATIVGQVVGESVRSGLEVASTIKQDVQQTRAAFAQMGARIASAMEQPSSARFVSVLHPHHLPASTVSSDLHRMNSTFGQLVADAGPQVVKTLVPETRALGAAFNTIPALMKGDFKMAAIEAVSALPVLASAPVIPFGATLKIRSAAEKLKAAYRPALTAMEKQAMLAAKMKQLQTRIDAARDAIWAVRSELQHFGTNPSAEGALRTEITKQWSKVNDQLQLHNKELQALSNNMNQLQRDARKLQAPAR